MKYFLLTIFLMIVNSVYAQVLPLLPSNMVAVNITASGAEYKAKKGVKILGTNYADTEMAVLNNSDFSNGTIDVDVSGARLAGTDTTFRGFIGISFRTKTENDTLKYECFYLRPTLGRDKDQLKRNHSTQYISTPNYSWQRLRKEAPGVYESYADMVPGEWIHLKIEVEGQRAFLFVNNATQPSLIVNDLKNSNIKSGALGLWIGPGTEGYFANLKVSRR